MGQRHKKAMSLLLGFLFTHRYVKYSQSGNCLIKFICLRNKMAKIQITYSNASHHLICINIQNGNFSVISARKNSVTEMNMIILHLYLTISLLFREVLISLKCSRR